MQLIIIQSLNDLSLLKKNYLIKSDILVFSQRIMQKLDKYKIKYKTIENFFSSENYFKDVLPFRGKVKNLLSKLDQASEKLVNYPYFYSSNELYFLTWFDDLFYLERLISYIKNNYKKVYLLSSYEPKNLDKIKFSFSMLNSRKINGTISFPYERSEERNIQLIYNSIDIIFIKDKNSSNHIPIRFKISHFWNRLLDYYKRKIHLNKSKNNKILSNKNAYLVQESYEVIFLKKYLFMYNYLNPVVKLRKEIENEKILKLKNYLFLENIIEKFTEENLKSFKQYLNIFISSYLIELATRVSAFKEKFINMINKDKPCFLLLGSGTRDIFDTICCHVANIHKIPVFIFQHGGSRVFFYTPYQESLEYNKRVFKFLIVQSRLDELNISNESTDVKYFGSIEQYEEMNTLPNYKSTKDILFCLGPDTNYSFRQLLNNFSVKKKYSQFLDILDCTENEELRVDVKLHPTGQKDNLSCCSEIIRDKGYKNTKIIYGGSAERISLKYNVIIIDSLASAIVKHFLCLKIPIIIYESDFDRLIVNKEVLSDLSKRCYIARNKNELKEIINKYKRKELHSKWSKTIIDKYVYPIKEGNPGINISNYINDIVMKFSKNEFINNINR